MRTKYFLSDIRITSNLPLHRLALKPFAEKRHYCSV
jgi:hypothetical protein